MKPNLKWCGINFSIERFAPKVVRIFEWTSGHSKSCHNLLMFGKIWLFLAIHKNLGNHPSDIQIKDGIVVDPEEPLLKDLSVPPDLRELKGLITQ